jgi:hypothetical protein
MVFPQELMIQSAGLYADPIGLCRLYWGHDTHGRLCVAAQMKVLV